MRQSDIAMSSDDTFSTPFQNFLRYLCKNHGQLFQKQAQPDPCYVSDRHVGGSNRISFVLAPGRGMYAMIVTQPFSVSNVRNNTKHPAKVRCSASMRLLGSG